MKEELLKRIKEATEETQIQRRIREQAKLIQDYIKGDQWKEMNFSTNTIQAIPYPDDVEERLERPVDNFIFPIYRTYKALILNYFPQIRAVPQNAEDIEDTLGAEIAEILVRYNHRTLLVEKNRASQMANILLTYGSVFIHPYFDPDKKELDCLFIPPTQIFPYPPGEKNPQNILGFVWQRVVPIEIIKRLYPNVDFNKIQSAPPEYLDDRISEKKNYVIVEDYYEKPLGNSAGCMVRVCGNTILEDRFLNSYPYEHNQLPFININENEVENELFGFPSLGLLLQTQLEHNKIESIILEFAKKLPILLVSIESKIDPKKIINPLRRVLEYYSLNSAPPTYTYPPPLSRVLLEKSITDPQRAEHNIGLHAVTMRAESVGSLQSGVALETLQETDRLRLLPLFTNLANAYIQFHNQCYEIMRTKYPTEKIKAILGDLGELHYSAFKKIKLSAMSFYLETESAMPTQQALERERAIQALQYGAIDLTDKKQRRELLKILVPKLAAAFDEDIQEEGLARQENVRMLKGESVSTKQWDKDDIHLPIHNRIKKDIRFERLPLEIQSIFLAHIEAHEKRAKEKIDRILAYQRQIQSPAPTGQLPNLTTGG